ncbi:hypothetical protein BU26DRAFT_285317 [Trematosphaeria pertusa]|uniref:Uncharacterized protein n=1 Tax=Trematosphaeria pertusa TaxID=390896 RepID=A0A6A6IMS3_9PLEO|nr:uncharacterized protein BU26DRAFT_285317 [Trematosphaeria pertusa]KAF2251527.1 hypothetical protein BU26DRAFT_285317 [Trematosphaeria pertusa]
MLAPQLPRRPPAHVTPPTSILARRILPPRAVPRLIPVAKPDPAADVHALDAHHVRLDLLPPDVRRIAVEVQLGGLRCVVRVVLEFVPVGDEGDCAARDGYGAVDVGAHEADAVLADGEVERACSMVGVGCVATGEVRCGVVQGCEKQGGGGDVCGQGACQSRDREEEGCKQESAT